MAAHQRIITRANGIGLRCEVQASTKKGSAARFCFIKGRRSHWVDSPTAAKSFLDGYSMAVNVAVSPFVEVKADGRRA